MKKYIACVIICLVATPHVLGWGFRPEVAGGNSMLRHYLGKQEVEQPVCIMTTHPDIEPIWGLPQDSKVTQEQFLTMLQEAFNYWVEQPRSFLHQNNREAEFADFLAVWPKKITLKFTPHCEGENMLLVNYAPRGWYVTVKQMPNQSPVLIHKSHYQIPPATAYEENAWTEVLQHNARITLYERIDLLNLPQTLTHEVGHLLGLTDQYGFARYMYWGENTHSLFSLLTITGPNTQTINRQMRTYKPASIMGAKQYHAAALRKIWADDVDGLINLVDFIEVYLEGKFSPRVVNGWKSFSLPNQPVFYAFSMPFKPLPSTSQVPAQLLARIQAYQPKLGGIETSQLALLKEAFSDSQVAQYQVLQDLYTRQQVQQEVASLLSVPPVTLKAKEPVVLKPANSNLTMLITEADVAQYEVKHARSLRRIAAKNKQNKTLSRREQLLQNHYNQLKQNLYQNKAVAQEPPSLKEFGAYLSALHREFLQGTPSENTILSLQTAYLNARSKQPYAVTMEWFSYLNRPIGVQGKTVVGYLLANTHLLPPDQAREFKRSLEQDKQAYRLYENAVRSVRRARRQTANVQTDEAVAQAQTRRDHLTPAQTKQVNQLVCALAPLQNLLQEKNPVSSQVAYALRTEPFVTQNNHRVDTAAVLSTYGFYCGDTHEGAQLSATGELLAQNN